MIFNTDCTNKPSNTKKSPISDSPYSEVLMEFLKTMDAELQANSDKGGREGWLSMSREKSILEIHHHVAKLQKAVKDNDHNRIIEHSADVANMAMMCADVCGVIQPVNEKEERISTSNLPSSTEQFDPEKENAQSGSHQNPISDKARINLTLGAEQGTLRNPEQAIKSGVAKFKLYRKSTGNRLVEVPADFVFIEAKPELVVIRGLPGSGKSTLAAEKYPDHLHYEPDHLISDTRGRYRFDDQFFGEAQLFVRHLADFALARGESVVVSDVFPTLAELEPYQGLADAHGATFKVIDCTEQFGNCHRVPMLVMQRMREQFEPWPADGVVVPEFLKQQAD